MAYLFQLTGLKKKVMKKIDFSRMKMFLDVAHTCPVVQDVRKDFANLIYSLGSGIECHALAFKIYKSQGVDEYSDEECAIIKQFADRCTPAFIDAMNIILKENGEKL